MKTIGIRELKANLSRVLRDVTSGTSFLVTDRGRVIAELRQPGMVETSSASDEDRALARLASAGLLRIAERQQPAYRPSPIKSKKGLAKSLIDADRGK
jgi:antitoxin (DNA-binding transcriptional repressor) of toxin-antitoxin stability system